MQHNRFFFLVLKYDPFSFSIKEVKSFSYVKGLLNISGVLLSALLMRIGALSLASCKIFCLTGIPEVHVRGNPHNMIEL